MYFASKSIFCESGDTMQIADCKMPLAFCFYAECNYAELPLCHMETMDTAQKRHFASQQD